MCCFYLRANNGCCFRFFGMSVRLSAQYAFFSLWARSSCSFWSHINKTYAMWKLAVFPYPKILVWWASENGPKSLTLFVERHKSICLLPRTTMPILKYSQKCGNFYLYVQLLKFSTLFVSTIYKSPASVVWHDSLSLCARPIVSLNMISKNLPTTSPMGNFWRKRPS